jgi:hypothetical protein
LGAEEDDSDMRPVRGEDGCPDDDGAVLLAPSTFSIRSRANL